MLSTKSLLPILFFFFFFASASYKDTAHAVAMESWKPKLKVSHKVVCPSQLHNNMLRCTASLFRFELSKKSIWFSLCMQRTPHHQLPCTSWTALPVQLIEWTCDKHGQAGEGQFAPPITTNRLGILWLQQKRLMQVNSNLVQHCWFLHSTREYVNSKYEVQATFMKTSFWWPRKICPMYNWFMLLQVCIWFDLDLTFLVPSLSHTHLFQGSLCWRLVNGVPIRADQ